MKKKLKKNNFSFIKAPNITYITVLKQLILAYLQVMLILLELYLL